jgi:hypothetical protein
MAQESTTMNFVDKLVNDEGLKFSVTANLAPEIYAKLFVTIVLSVFVSIIGAQLIKNALKKAG